MSSDSGHRSSLKSFHSASLLSAVLESTASKIHPLEPGLDIDLDSPGTPDQKRRCIYESMGRISSSTRISESKKSGQHKR